MNDMERMMQADRAAGLPEMPDLRYTEAAVRRRLGRGAPEPAPKVRPGEWAVIAISPALLLLLGWELWRAGFSPWWLGVLPFSLLPMVPILLGKEHEGS